MIRLADCASRVVAISARQETGRIIAGPGLRPSQVIRLVDWQRPWTSGGRCLALPQGGSPAVGEALRWASFAHCKCFAPCNGRFEREG